MIENRLDLLQIFHDDQYYAEMINSELKRCKDIERALQRIHLKTGVPGDLNQIIITVKQVEIIKAHLANLSESLQNSNFKSAMNKLLSKLGSLNHLIEKYGNLFKGETDSDIESPFSIGTFQPGFSKELDKSRKIHGNLLKDKQRRAENLSRLFEIKCNLINDKRNGPVVEIGASSQKTTERIQKLIKKHDDFEPCVSGRLTGVKFKDHVKFF